MMDDPAIVAMFAALAQETRLAIVRLLVRAGEGGTAAGDIATAVGASRSNISFHLKELVRAGLVRQRREARSIIYSVRPEVLIDLVQFLARDWHVDFSKPARLLPARGLRSSAKR